VAQEHGLGLDFPIALTRKPQKQSGEIIAQLYSKSGNKYQLAVAENNKMNQWMIFHKAL